MAQIIGSRCVLAVRDLEQSTRYYVDVLGFRRDPIDAAGWSFLSRDTFKLMLGECLDSLPASELGDHSVPSCTSRSIDWTTTSGKYRREARW